MKHVLTLLFSLLAVAGLRAANPSFTDLIQTNITWVSKNGNDTTGRPGQPAKPFLTISNAVQVSPAGSTVHVRPGTYDESVNLKNGVNLHLPAGVVIDLNSAGTLDTVTDNNVIVTNTIDGFGIIRRTGAGNASGLRLVEDDSNVKCRVNYVEAVNAVVQGAVRANSGANLDFTGDVLSSGVGMTLGGHADTITYVRGRVYSTNDYGIVFGNGTNYFSGTVRSQTNSAISPSSGAGPLVIENSTLQSRHLYALEVAGGGTITVKNSILESLNNVDGTGNAISKYSGGLLILDDVQLIAGPNNVYCIDNQASGSHGSLEIRSACWANAPVNPAMNILSGSLVNSNTAIWKNSQIFKSVHDLTNIVARTNGNTWFPTGAASYSTIATNQIPVSGWTNNAEINVTVYVTATAVSFIIKNRSQATLYTSPVLTASMSVVLQPGWAVTAASGLVGTVLPW